MIICQPTDHMPEYIPTMAEEALNAAATLFHQRVVAGATTGPKGPDSLHMRIGTIGLNPDDTTRSPFVQWAERSLGPNGAHFAPITAAKAWTSSQHAMDSDVAAHMFTTLEGPRAYTGGVYYHATFKGAYATYEQHIVAACSGVAGTDDRAVAYALALVFASEWTKKLRQLLGE